MMNKKEIFDYFSILLDEIFSDDEASCCVTSPDYDDYYECANGIIIARGISRCTVIDPAYKWVVKFDISHGHYCDREIELYQQAIDNGIEDMFPECDYIGTYENDDIEIPLFAYEKIECDYVTHDLTANEYKQVLPYDKSPLAATDMSIAADLLNIWGEEKFECLNWFCLEHDINDIHIGNVGWRKNKLVIIDFAGYHSAIDK